MMGPNSMVRLGVLLLGFLSAAFTPADQASYKQQVEQWRQKYQQILTSEDGWLTVSGLFWLHEGENSFGSAAGNDVVLPAPVPAKAGHFDLHQGKITVHINPGAGITMGGKPVQDTELRPDSKQDRLVSGDLTFYVHGSGDRFAIRLKDKNGKIRKDFHGLRWFGIDPAYHFAAHFVPYDSPREVDIDNVMGDHGKIAVAGNVSFTMQGKEYQLEAEQNQDKSLFVVFRDLTSKKDTYQAARFLDLDAPINGNVDLDFNEAYNPPCAYNPYTTCPLPTPQNRLQVEIPAGEKRYHD